MPISKLYASVSPHPFLNDVLTYYSDRSAAICSRWFLARGFFYPEDGGDTFLRNVGSHKIYTAPHPRRRHSSETDDIRNKQICTKWVHFIDFHLRFNESVIIYIFLAPLLMKSRVSAVDWLRSSMTKESEFESQWGQGFLLLHVVQTGYGAHPASYPMGTGGSFPRGKAAGA
jgi:hypothetical protein